MKRIIRKSVLPFPEIKVKVDKKKFLLEFFPIIYWREEIEKWEAEITVLRMNKPEPYLDAMRWGLEECRKELKKALDNDAQEFKKKNKETIENIEIKAKRGDKASLFCLIRWSKEWLFKDWVRKKVLIAEALRDREFLDRLAKAIKTIKKKPPQYQLIRFLKKLKVAGYPFHDKKKTKKLREYLYNYFNDLTVENTETLSRKFVIDENNVIFRPLSSMDNFNKLLRRNKIRE